MRNFVIDRQGHCMRGAFTLLETMIVVAIVVFLTGITVTVTSSVMRQSEIRSTEQTLRLLDMVVSEWEMESGRKLTWMAYGDDYPTNLTQTRYAEVHAATPEVLIINEVLDACRRVSASKRILAQIDPDNLYEYSHRVRAPWISPPEQAIVQSEFIGSLTVLDAWGTPIYATHPGRLHDIRSFPYDEGRKMDTDGTIRTYNENKYGIARHRRVCFVSAGPDRKFGYVHAAPTTADLQATYDNLWSYPTE